MDKKTISILGCGWLGLPLAQHLKSEGWNIKGSTTTSSKLEQIEQMGIDPFLISLTPRLECDDCSNFWNSRILFLNIPPGRRRPDVEERFPEQVKSVISHLTNSPIEWVIFAGSTSVYSSSDTLVREKDASRSKSLRASGRALLHAEELLHSAHGFKTTVLRFGGLYGYDRHPANYLAGKKNLKNASAPVNLIHRDDCIQIIDGVLNNELIGETYNCVSDGHPPRREFYKAAAHKLGVEPPEFIERENNRTKIVANDKIKEALDYTFFYPNPMDL